MIAKKEVLLNNNFGKNWKEKIPNYMYKLMLLMFIGIFLFATFISNYENATVLVYAAFLVFVSVKLVKKHDTIFDSYSDTKLLVALSIACFLVKFLWIYFMKMEPSVDYLTFFYSAKGLSEATLYESRYIALFPHIFGYSTFLSFFFEIFGASVFLATLLNVFLSVFSGVFIYKIIRNMVSSTAAVYAYVLWIVCPSQTIYNSLVLSDPLYTMFILAFIYFVTVIAKKETAMNWPKMLACGVVAAIILMCINVNRPIAMILIISMFIWVFILRFKELLQKDFIVKWLSFFAGMLVVYFSLSGLWNAYFTLRIGEAPASVPGYNVYVGFNTQSGGSWNLADSELLFSYSDQDNATADWAQKQMFNEAINRITSGNIDFTELFKNKLENFLGDDSACVGYCSDIIDDNNYIGTICNVFYYFTILMSLFGAYKMLKLYHKSSVFILPLYVIGITCAQMLVEVAPRYHYSIIPFLIMISQFYLFKKREDSVKL